MHKILFLLFFTFGNLTVFCQTRNASWEITNNTSKYSVNEYIIKTYSYEIKNKSDDYLWLWFSNNDKGEIKKYFFSRRNGFNLFDIAMEVNIEFKPSIFNTFIKRIKPKEKFNIYFISNNADSDIHNDLDQQVLKRIKIYREKQLLEYDKKFSLMLESSFLFYKSNYIIIPFEEFILLNDTIGN